MGLQDSISKGSPDIQNQEDMILLEGRKDITVGGKQFWLQSLSAKEHTNDGLRSHPNWGTSKTEASSWNSFEHLNHNVNSIYILKNETLHFFPKTAFSLQSSAQQRNPKQFKQSYKMQLVLSGLHSTPHHVPTRITS